MTEIICIAQHARRIPVVLLVRIRLGLYQVGGTRLTLDQVSRIMITLDEVGRL